MHNHCFHADESYYDPATESYTLIRVERDKPGYQEMGGYNTVERAKEAAAARNMTLGVSDAERLDILASSMRASNLHNDDPEPEIRIAITDMDGTVIDIIETTREALLDDVKRHPHGLLSGINTNLVGH